MTHCARMISSRNTTHAHRLPGANVSGQACATQDSTPTSRGFEAQLYFCVLEISATFIFLQ